MVQCTHLPSGPAHPAGSSVTLARDGADGADSTMMSYENFQSFGRDGVEAAMRSFGAVSNGVQTVASESAEFAKRSLEQSTQTVEKLLGARTFDVAAQIQGDYLRSSYENLVAQASRIGELTTTVAKEVAAPIEGLFSKAAKTA